MDKASVKNVGVEVNRYGLGAKKHPGSGAVFINQGGSADPAEPPEPVDQAVRDRPLPGPESVGSVEEAWQRLARKIDEMAEATHLLAQDLETVLRPEAKEGEVAKRPPVLAPSEVPLVSALDMLYERVAQTDQRLRLIGSRLALR